MVDRAIIFRVISRCAVEIRMDLEYDIWVKIANFSDMEVSVMKDGFIKVAAATPSIRVADCRYNAEQIFTLMR